MVSILALRKLAKKCKVKRISALALRELRYILLEEAKEIARDAWELARFAGRRTVLARDVKLAIKRRGK